jgi:hypothetical protein
MKKKGRGLRLGRLDMSKGEAEEKGAESGEEECKGNSADSPPLDGDERGRIAGSKAPKDHTVADQLKAQANEYATDEQNDEA